MVDVKPVLEYRLEIYGHDLVQSAVDVDFLAFFESQGFKVRPRRQERLDWAAELDSIGLRPSLHADDWERLETPYLFDPLGPLLNEVDKSVHPLSERRLEELHQIGRELLKTLDPEIPDQRQPSFVSAAFFNQMNCPSRPRTLPCQGFWPLSHQHQDSGGWMFPTVVFC
ncbi:hypothetical protein IV102_33290 [bacterium]|nr:hypothetical protein [bacterium]